MGECKTVFPPQYILLMFNAHLRLSYKGMLMRKYQKLASLALIKFP